jgi:hypothetical protein
LGIYGGLVSRYFLNMSYNNIVNKLNTILGPVNILLNDKDYVLTVSTLKSEEQK